jgi:hypothetical protein
MSSLQLREATFRLAGHSSSGDHLILTREGLRMVGEYRGNAWDNISRLRNSATLVSIWGALRTLKNGRSCIRVRLVGLRKPSVFPEDLMRGSSRNEINSRSASALPTRVAPSLGRKYPLGAWQRGYHHFPVRHSVFRCKRLGLESQQRRRSGRPPRSRQSQRSREYSGDHLPQVLDGISEPRHRLVRQSWRRALGGRIWISQRCYGWPQHSADRGPNNFDLNLTKSIPLGETRRLELRGQPLNAFKHPQYVNVPPMSVSGTLARQFLNRNYTDGGIRSMWAQVKVVF